MYTKQLYIVNQLLLVMTLVSIISLFTRDKRISCILNEILILIILILQVLICISHGKTTQTKNKILQRNLYRNPWTRSRKRLKILQH